MKHDRLALSSFVFGICLTSLAHADVAAKSPRFVAPQQGVTRAIEFGTALPPAAYKRFCATNQNECRFKGGKSERLQLTEENWAQILQVNRYVNTRITSVPDTEFNGVADIWSYPVDKGDCEDLVLLKKKYLKDMGFSANQLLITVVLDENREGHAVLTIPTNKGDYVLDNRREDVLRWDATGYIFLKRQSQQRAIVWMSLQKDTIKVLTGTQAQ